MNKHRKYHRNRLGYAAARCCLTAAVLLFPAGWGTGKLVAAEADAQPVMPDIILIAVESLRADHVTCYGYHRQTTPAIDRLAAEGIRFTKASASSGWTMPSMASLFTGTLPRTHKAVSYRHAMAAGLATLPAELRRAGYHTVGITANPTTHGRFGFDRGFAFYDDMTVVAGLDPSRILSGRASLPYRQRITGDSVTAFALGTIRGHDPSRPLFLHAFYFDPHYDFTPPVEYRTLFTDPLYAGRQNGLDVNNLRADQVTNDEKAHIIALYDAEIRYTDDQIARLLKALEDSGRAGNTVVVLVGDHGEEFWERDRLGHGHSLFEELVHVPLVVRWPAQLPAGLVIDKPVSMTDIMPMLLEFAGLEPPDQCIGANPLPIGPEAQRTAQNWNADPDPRVRFMATELEEPWQVAARQRDLKVIWKGRSHRPRLYDLAADPGERNDLSGTAEESRFTALVEALETYMDRTGDTDRSGVPPDTEDGTRKTAPALQEALRSLGYIR